MDFTTIIWAVVVLGALAIVFGLILAVAAKVFEVEVDPRLPEIQACLAGANCGGCGYPGCAGCAEIVPLPCPELVEFVERGELDSPALTAYLARQLGPYAGRVDAAVLGCTHFPFARRAIRAALGGNVTLYDGSDGTARETLRQLVRRGWVRGGSHGAVTLENSLPSELPLSRRLLALPRED